MHGHATAAITSTAALAAVLTAVLTEAPPPARQSPPAGASTAGHVVEGRLETFLGPPALVAVPAALHQRGVQRRRRAHVAHDLLFEQGSAAGTVARFNLSWILGGEKTGNGVVPSWAAAKAP